MRKIILALTALLAAAPASAAIIPCSPALEAEGQCVAGQYLLVLIAASTEDVQRLAAAEAERINYQPTVACSLESREDDAGVLVLAGVDAGQCDLLEVGQVVPNPQPAADAVSAVLAHSLRERTADAERRRQQEAVPTPAPPDIRPERGQP